MKYIYLIIIFFCTTLFAQNKQSQQKDSFYLNIIKGDSLSAKKRYNEALKLYRFALSASLDNRKIDKAALAYKKLGILFYKKKEYAFSENKYRKSFLLDSISKNAADVLYNLFLIKRKLNQQDSVLIYLKNSIRIYKKNAYNYSSYNTFLTAGIIFKNRQLYDEALEYLIIAYNGFEKLKNKKKLAAVCTTFGNIHYRLKNYNQALKYQYQSLSLEKKLKNKKGIARSYINIGNVHDDLKKQDSAIYNYQRSLDFLEPKTRLHAKTVGNLGFFYIKIGNLELAQRNLKLAVNTNKFLKDTTAILYNYNGLSSVYLQHNNLQKVKIYLNLIEPFLKATSDQLVKLDYYKNKVNYLQRIENYKSALKFQQQYSNLYEEIYNTKQSEIIQTIHARFDQKKKENKILKLQLANKNNQLLLAKKNKAISRQNLILIVLLLVILIVFILYYIISQKQKASKQQTKIEKLEAIYNGQETIKKRIARDLHDIITTNFDGLRLKILALKKASDKNALINETTNEIKNINNQIRTVSHRLSPLEMQMTSQKFIKVIKARLSEFQLYGEIFVELENQLPEVLNTLDLSSKNNFYGILLEVLNNVEKHSHASKLRISSKEKSNFLYITFKDNGIGISKNTPDGIGLLNIKQRSEILNGSCTIKSFVSGTQVCISFPIKKV